MWRRVGEARDLEPLEAFRAGAIVLRGGGLRAILECATLAFGIKGEAEQRAVVDGWAALLNSLAHPLEVVVRSRELDPQALLPAGAGDDRLRGSYRRLLDELAGRREVVDRRYFVIVPWDPPSRPTAAAAAEGVEVLEQRLRWVTECLRRLDLEPRRLEDHELASSLRGMLDPAAGAQPIAVADALLDAADLVAPAGAREGPAAFALGERLARTVAVTRYPARLHPGWLGDVQAFAGDLDLALHIQPSAGSAVMAFLERRIAELSSSVRLAEVRGGRGDPYRRAALQDAIELQDRIVQGSERLFDASLYLTVWADGPDALDRATRRIEALLGARLIHTRRLFFQMRLGLVATLPFGRDPVGVRRVLSTSALAATFPFTGSDLPLRSGLLYGINTQTRSPVVLDRFALENHNAVVFATSGAGKSYLVKVELARAALAGVRALVIDPEGEYAPLLSSLGSAVVPVRPGVAPGFDPFALAEASPGALSARIAILTTLFELLCGGLQLNERPAIEEALSFAFARAGITDGAPPVRRGPRLIDVQLRLKGRPGMEALALRLERYVSGAGAWLFARDGAVDPAPGPSCVYVLAGLPEELRAAAMFLVLDRIWTSLAAPRGPTLVVVDEAWWLMRHPDTAAYLFRLVKTSRKRRAGLTLITQDVSDVLASPDGEALVSNAALQILMKQAPQAIARLAELFRLTRAEQSWLLGAQRGEGLLLAQGRRVPFAVVASEEEARRIEARRGEG